MDVKKKEMDLLSNSMAAYAHIKGELRTISDSTVLLGALEKQLLRLATCCTWSKSHSETKTVR